MIIIDGSEGEGGGQPVALYCNRCRIRLSAPVILVPERQLQPQWHDVKDGDDLVPVGTVCESASGAPWMGTSYDGYLAFAPQFWMNPDDRSEAICDTQDSQRLLGCCGVSGFWGFNQICRCKAEVGTLHDDCGLPRYFIPNPATTTLRSMTGDYWNYE